MNILLLNTTSGLENFPSKRKNLTGPAYLPPIGLLYIATALEQDGHHVTVLDLFCEQQPDNALKKALRSVDVVGISIYSSLVAKAADIARTVKEYDSDIFLMIGGPHSISFPDKALEDIPAADISIHSEAEHIITRIPEYIQGKTILQNIPNLTYRKHNEIKKTKDAPVITNLDALPFPARHLIKKYEYGRINKIPLFKPKLTSLVSSRGCPYHCRFCSRHIPTIQTFRKRSAENVVEELIAINKDFQSVMIVDENFLVDKKRALHIMDEIISHNLDLELYIQGARVDSADKTLYTKMKQAGVKHIQFGIESGNQDVLDFYRKQITINQIRYALKLADAMQFITSATFILGAPLETKQHIQNTISFAKSLPLDIAFFYQLSYQAHSDLWEEAIKEGLINKNERHTVFADKRRGLSQFTAEELERFCQQAFLQFYLNPRYLLRQIIKAGTRKDTRLLKVGLSYLTRF